MLGKRIFVLILIIFILSYDLRQIINPDYRIDLQLEMMKQYRRLKYIHSDRYYEYIIILFHEFFI